MRILSDDGVFLVTLSMRAMVSCNTSFRHINQTLGNITFILGQVDDIWSQTPVTSNYKLCILMTLYHFYHLWFA